MAMTDSPFTAEMMTAFTPLAATAAMTESALISRKRQHFAGDGDDIINADGSWAGSSKIHAGIGNDTITAKDLKIAEIDAGDGDDRITIARAHESVQVKTGSGSDTIVLTTQQLAYKAIEVTDFTAGEHGDVLDLSDLLTNAAIDYDGSNPFGTGKLSRASWQ